MEDRSKTFMAVAGVVGLLIVILGALDWNSQNHASALKLAACANPDSAACTMAACGNLNSVACALAVRK